MAYNIYKKSIRINYTLVCVLLFTKMEWTHTPACYWYFGFSRILKFDWSRVSLGLLDHAELKSQSHLTASMATNKKNSTSNLSFFLGRLLICHLGVLYYVLPFYCYLTRVHEPICGFYGFVFRNKKLMLHINGGFDKKSKKLQENFKW